MKTLTLPTEMFEVTREDQDNPDLIPVTLESGSLDDWFLHVNGKPLLYFNDMLKLCSSILACDMTKKYAPSIYLEDGLQFDEKPIQLKDHYFSGAKRVNARVGEYVNSSDPLAAILTGVQTHTTKHTEDNQFVMHGKDESCLVEGSWDDWLCFVGNILASETVKHNYPDLYQPQLKNENY